jgi:hypothetical protein
MAAGFMRARGSVTTMTPGLGIGSPFDYAQAMDELFPQATMELADGVTDQALIVLGTGGVITIQGLALSSTEAISVKLGSTGGNLAFTLAAGAPLVLMGISLTLVSLSNASGAMAVVTYTCGGE